jgi:hypothetical protein
MLVYLVVVDQKLQRYPSISIINDVTFHDTQVFFYRIHLVMVVAASQNGRKRVLYCRVVALLQLLMAEEVARAQELVMLMHHHHQHQRTMHHHP